jgi:MYXO-CTERM domain-containing protein
MELWHGKYLAIRHQFSIPVRQGRCIYTKKNRALTLERPTAAMNRHNFSNHRGIHMRRLLRMPWWAVALCFGLASVVTLPAIAATTYSFNNITNNTTASGSDFSVTIDVVAGGASFAFVNNSTTGTITEIYWYERSSINPDIFTGAVLLPLPSGWAATDVDGAAPPNLPGFNDAAFVASVAADQGGNSGIGPGTVTPVVFNLGLSTTLANLLAAIEKNPFDVAIGIHVHDAGFKPGTSNLASDSFLNGPPVVPVPPAAALGLLGMGALGAIRARKRK